MLAAILGIAQQLLILINHFLDQEAKNKAAVDAEDDAEAQNVKNQVRALGDSVSATVDALQQLRAKQQASEAAVSGNP
jgi:hypothetical protein